MIKYLLLISTFLLLSCYDSRELRNATTFNDLFVKTIKFADNFNAKEHRIEPGKPLPKIYRVIKKFIRYDNKKYFNVLHIEVPYNLRGDRLFKFLELFGVEKIDGKDGVEIIAYHFGIKNISGVIAKYYAIPRTPANDKPVTKYEDNLSKNSLEKRGIKHYLLDRDYQVLLLLSREMGEKWPKNRKKLISRVSKKYDISSNYIGDVIKFAASYYNFKFR